MDYHSLYAQKLCSPEEAVRIVKDGDWVDYSETCSYPQALDAALAARSGELQDVKIRSAISMIPIATVENDPHGSFTYNLWHCSALDRKYVDQGRAYHLPMLFRHNGTYYRKGYAPVNVAMVTVAPMDENGNFSFGLTNCTQQEVLDAAEHIVVEVNPTMPTIAMPECRPIPMLMLLTRRVLLPRWSLVRNWRVDMLSIMRMTFAVGASP